MRATFDNSYMIRWCDMWLGIDPTAILIANQSRPRAGFFYCITYCFYRILSTVIPALTTGVFNMTDLNQNARLTWITLSR